jgi:hypothetical protein
MNESNEPVIPKVTASTETLMQQGPMTALDYLYTVLRSLEDRFGDKPISPHIATGAALTAAAATDFATAQMLIVGWHIATDLHRVAEALDRITDHNKSPLSRIADALERLANQESAE